MFKNKINKKIYITVFSFLFLTASVGIGVYLGEQAQKTNINAAGATLTLTSNNTNPKVGDVFTAAATMNTQGLLVTGADIKIKYDPTRLTATSVVPGPFLPYIFIPGSIDAVNGTVDIVVGPPLDSTGAHPVSGTGLVVSVNFTAKATGTTAITFDATTKVSASGQTTNQVGVTTPVTINIISSTSPTPVASRSPSPTPLASRTPTPRPTPPAQTPGPTYTLAQVGQHSTQSNCWLIIYGKVYDVTAWIPIHPGGVSKITNVCGKDATSAFVSGGHTHSTTAWNTLATYYVGEYSGVSYTPSPSPTPVASPSHTPTPSPLHTPSPSPVRTGTPTSVPTQTPTHSPSPTPTRTPTPLPSHSPTPVPSPIQTPANAFTLGQVALHSSVNDCWLIISNKVYNVTNWIPLHPGGIAVITSVCGTDATNTFLSGIHNHSQTAVNILATYYIGELIPSTGYVAGDVNHDGIVNIVDVGIVVDNYDSYPVNDTRADINGDGIVSIVDVGLVIDNYGYGL